MARINSPLLPTVVGIYILQSDDEHNTVHYTTYHYTHII
jgi:hypothetical protein